MFDSDKRYQVDLVTSYLLFARCQSETDDIIGLKKTIIVDVEKLMKGEILNSDYLSISSQSLHSNVPLFFAHELHMTNPLKLFFK